MRRAVGEKREGSDDDDDDDDEIIVLDSSGLVLSQSESSWKKSSRVDHKNFQLLRFFDCSVEFNKTEGWYLLSKLENVIPSKRQTYWSTSVLSRRRSLMRWAGTTLAPYLLLKSSDVLDQVRELKIAIVIMLADMGMTAFDLCKEIDLDGDLMLGVDELVSVLKDHKRFPDLEGFKMHRLVKPLLQLADTNRSGKLSYIQMSEFLNFDTDAAAKAAGAVGVEQRSQTQQREIASWADERSVDAKEAARHHSEMRNIESKTALKHTSEFLNAANEVQRNGFETVIWKDGDYVLDPETIPDLAKKSDSIWIRKADDHEYGAKSKLNAWPMECVRAGKAPSKPLAGGDATREMVAEGWEGPVNILEHFWNSNVQEYNLVKGQMIYHACCNGGGIHLGGGQDTFIYGQRQGVEVLLVKDARKEKKQSNEVLTRADIEKYNVTLAGTGQDITGGETARVLARAAEKMYEIKKMEDVTMSGAWLNPKDVPIERVESIKLNNTNTKVYMIYQGEHIKMVTPEGDARLFKANGLDDFSSDKWDTYASADGNYVLNFKE